MIELRKVSKRFAHRMAVDEVSLSVHEGELLVLLGSSGSGKTTTLKMINRLVEPSSGTLLVEGRDTRALVPHELRRRIGYCFQSVGLFPHMTVEENIAITPRLLGWERRAIEARVERLLELVELAPEAFRSRLPDQLSGGEKQRVGVARALAAEPRIILFDEPFAALDPLTRDRLQQWLLATRRQVVSTAVFVTHDMAEAILLGDRIAVLSEGRVVQVGTARELVADPVNEYVESLMSTPARQAHTIERLLGGISDA